MPLTPLLLALLACATPEPVAEPTPEPAVPSAAVPSAQPPVPASSSAASASPPAPESTDPPEAPSAGVEATHAPTDAEPVDVTTLGIPFNQGTLRGGSGTHEGSFDLNPTRYDKTKLRVVSPDNDQVVRRIIYRQLPQHRDCIGDGDGISAWELTITDEGTVSNVSSVRQTFPSADTACVERHLRRTRFPASYAGTARVHLTRG